VPSSARNKSKRTSSVIPSSQRSGSRLKRQFESGAARFLYDRYVGTGAALAEAYEQEALNAEIARTIHKLRTRAGLSQRELARRVGTSASAICRLEDADYEGHSLSLLKRIAEALGSRVEVRFVAAERLRTRTS
jgi:ribosome-binding protein aMBF1 (putative translation factor)